MKTTTSPTRRQAYSLPDQFVPRYFNLIDCPAYVQVMGATFLGSFYTLLRRNIWRNKGRNHSPHDHLPTALLTRGLVTATVRDTSLARSLGVTPRYIRDLRKDLLRLGLIQLSVKAHHNDDLHTYVLGELEPVGSKLREVLEEEKWVQLLRDGKVKELSEHLLHPPELPCPGVLVMRVKNVPEMVDKTLSQLALRRTLQDGTGVPSSWNSSSILKAPPEAVQDAPEATFFGGGIESSEIEHKREEGQRTPPGHDEETQQETCAVAVTHPAVMADERPQPDVSATPASEFDAKRRAPGGLGESPLFAESELRVTPAEHRRNLVPLMEQWDVRKVLDYLGREAVEPAGYLLDLKRLAGGRNYAAKYALAAYVDRAHLAAAHLYSASEWLYLWWRAYELDAQHVTREAAPSGRRRCKNTAELFGNEPRLIFEALSKIYKDRKDLRFAQLGWMHNELTRFLNTQPDYVETEQARMQLAAALVAAKEGPAAKDDLLVQLDPDEAATAQLDDADLLSGMLAALNR